mmetsp:Transcript_114292/g.334152  ORF Transcript_114292/g.334152 Transcript_114292/m.334152 type:complete len:205 (-) Transcript_114292:405-1019(-)
MCQLIGPAHEEATKDAAGSVAVLRHRRQGVLQHRLLHQDLMGVCQSRHCPEHRCFLDQLASCGHALLIQRTAQKVAFTPRPLRLARLVTLMPKLEALSLLVVCDLERVDLRCFVGLRIPGDKGEVGLHERYVRPGGARPHTDLHGRPSYESHLSTHVDVILDTGTVQVLDAVYAGGNNVQILVRWIAAPAVFEGNGSCKRIQIL